MTVGKLIDRIAAAGFEVQLTDHGPRLMPMESGARMPFDLLSEVKSQRVSIIYFLQTGCEPGAEEVCAVCGRITTAEDREVLAGNHLLCDRAGTRTEPRCPYKPRRAA